MSKTIFKSVPYEVGVLINDIGRGRIALPDIQRPFVWKNVLVRDLFDSMYRGYPIGYLLLWENGAAETQRAIGVSEKQDAPGLVIVDGQQRLTSLYAVFRGERVVRENFVSERIRIAFNPLEGKFEVATPATEKDPRFVADISTILSEEVGLIAFCRQFFERLRGAGHELTAEQERTIEESLTKLNMLSTFPLTALQLSADIGDEDVAEVFVRVNSQGKTLNQADFILTLMSVFWDEGRMELEAFSRQALQPSESDSLSGSPYQHFIKPMPAQLLRVAISVAFERARLRSIYSVLRGKDLETGKFDSERREQQFALLKDAQQRTLDLNHWHGFMHCLKRAGFRSERMIMSQNALLNSYALYLIGSTKLSVPEQALRSAVARWFFMASLTGRYTGSSETALESDLAMLRGVETAEQFTAKLAEAERIALTDDFWTVTLPNELATAAPRSPSLFAFDAALVILEAPVLFSGTKVGDWLDPAVKPPKSIRRHHLFPRAFLQRQGVTRPQEINQIANQAYVEWQDNIAISDQAPAEYLPAMCAGIAADRLALMLRLHALPDGWEQLPYEEFLRRRREEMAKIIREAYERLISEPVRQDVAPVDIAEIIAAGEGDRVEYKSTLRANLHTGKNDPRMEGAVVKTIAGFLNTHGGTLMIGVADDGNPVGIDADGFANEDKMHRHLTNLVNDRIGHQAWMAIHVNFDDHEDVRVLVVRCEKAQSPAYVKEMEGGGGDAFYIRTGAATVALSTQETVEYVRQRFAKRT